MEPTIDTDLTLAAIRKNGHSPSEILELYALGRLDDAQIEAVETHLLVCSHCQDVLTEIDNYVVALKAGLQEPQQARVPFWQKWGGPALAFGGAAAVLALTLAVGGWPSIAPEPATILLQSVRGDVTDPVEAPSKPLRLSLRSEPWKFGPGMRAEIVDTSGREVWSGVPEGGSLHVQKALAAGSYWVRLFDSRQLVQEYGLRVR